MAPDHTPVLQTVDHLFRHEAGKMVAVLAKLLGWQHMELAEDMVQDCLLQAMHTWAFKGMPDNPAAWLHRVARNKAIDYLRRQKRWETISPQYAHSLQVEYNITATVEQQFEAIEDNMLSMLFACCHPCLTTEAQIALALKTLCGLSSAEIARAFLTTEETIAKRIYRAREKLRLQGIALELPHSSHLPHRLQAVLHCLYLLFNEGYNASHPDRLIREELCEEAMRLTFLLTHHPLTATPRTYALLALFCFQASRFEARLLNPATVIVLQQQDRSLWHRPLIAQGFSFLEQAAEPFEVSTYHLEAGIASMHAAAFSFEQTNWQTIYQLYNTLYALQPTPMVALNKAIAAAYAMSPGEGLVQLNALQGLEKHYLYHAAIAEMYCLLQQKDRAVRAYEEALQLVHTRPERQLLLTKMSKCLSATENAAS
jgi:RNA polymerase sigma factor (sigma-70 family)